MYSNQNYESLAKYYTCHYMKQVNKITTVAISRWNHPKKSMMTHHYEKSKFTINSYVEDMDIDVPLPLESQMNASILDPKNDDETSELPPDIYVKPLNRLVRSHWPIGMFQDVSKIFDSECDIKSFHQTRQPMPGHTNVLNQRILSHLDNPGLLSECESALSDENASESSYQGDKTPLGATPIIKPREINSFAATSSMI
jgi:hypothetical protein